MNASLRLQGTCCLAALLLTTACSTLRPLPRDSGSLAEALEPGDRVHLITRDGQDLEFDLKAVSEGKIVGEHQEVAVADLARIEKKEIHPWKTAGLGLGILAGVVAAAFILGTLAYAGAL